MFFSKFVVNENVQSIYLAVQMTGYAISCCQNLLRRLNYVHYNATIKELNFKSKIEFFPCLPYMVCSYFINRKKANAKTMSVKVRSHRTSALTYPIFFIFIRPNNRMAPIPRSRSLELAPHPLPSGGVLVFLKLCKISVSAKFC